MKKKLTIYQRIEEFIKKSKIPTAYALFLYIITVQYIPKNWISAEFREVSLWPAALALGLIVLRVFFDIYKKINEPKKSLPFFNKWTDVINSGEFLNRFEKRLYDDRVINLKIMGISLRNHWNYIRNLMDKYLEDDKNVEFNITLAMLDVNEYDNLDFIDEEFKYKYHTQAISAKSDIENFIKLYGNKTKTSKCNVELIEYNYMPSFYGISLDDKFLFLGNTYWENNNLRSAGQSYNLYVEDDDFSGSEKIQIFNSWFEYIKNKNLKKEKTIANN